MNMFIRLNGRKDNYNIHSELEVKVKRVKAAGELHLTTTGNHIPYGITQCYLPPGRSDFPVFTPAEAGTRFSDPEGMQG